jgi:hypothetical protein
MRGDRVAGVVSVRRDGVGCFVLVIDPVLKWLTIKFKRSSTTCFRFGFGPTIARLLCNLQTFAELSYVIGIVYVHSFRGRHHAAGRHIK